MYATGRAALGAALMGIAVSAWGVPKRVLHYHKMGGYNHVSGVAGATATLNKLATQYAFTVRHTDRPEDLRTVKDYDILIYDNNVDAQASTPGLTEQKAVEDYVNGGGKWLGFHGAGDHHQNWKWYNETVFNGSVFQGHDGGQFGLWRMTTANPAITRMWDYLEKDLKAPNAQVTFDTEEYYFNKTVFGVAGVEPLQEIRGTAANYPNHVFTWTRKVGNGRMLYTALGHQENDFTQNSDWLTKAIYAYMRFLVGDFDTPTALAPTPREMVEAVRLEGSAVSVGLPGECQVRVTDAAGKAVWSASGRAPVSPRLGPGIHFVQVWSQGAYHARKLIIP